MDKKLLIDVMKSYADNKINEAKEKMNDKKATSKGIVENVSIGDTFTMSTIKGK